MAQADVLTDAEAAEAGPGGKYLTFGLGGEEYGLEILKVREIIGAMDITSVPRTPDFVMGVINLRGNVIPVIDLRLKFGMAHADQTDETCIIVVDVLGMEMGILVDRVSEVLDIAEGEIQPAPSFGVAVDTDFILGIGKAADKVTILLNISEVLSSVEVGEISRLADCTLPEDVGEETEEVEDQP
ncbi:MAG: chemotaxis protein CheW [Armatimonadota bacterium]